MPPGLTVEGLMGFLVPSLGEEGARAWFEWFAVTYPSWAREGWGRVDDARRTIQLTRPPGPS